jgi:4'-phosphopantetheinyl transferase
MLVAKTHSRWELANTPPSLNKSECHVWLWELLNHPNVDPLLSVLSTYERSIANRFIYEEDRARYIDCHNRVRRLLGLYLSCQPGTIDITNSERGKPELADRSSGLHFSISHTSSYALLAVAHSALGVDLEEIRPIEPAVAELNFSDSEKRQLAQYKDEEWTRCFFRCWTRKEAVLKAEGIGLTANLTSFDVEIAKNSLPRILRRDAEGGVTQDWDLHDISPTNKIVAALAVNPRVRSLRLLSHETALVGS